MRRILQTPIASVDRFSGRHVQISQGKKKEMVLIFNRRLFSKQSAPCFFEDGGVVKSLVCVMYRKGIISKFSILGAIYVWLLEFLY
mmetsp:Transcript_20210/g.29340  ORF Transcript_20210/g.29340 Transcript_20210/m.29340 type:complete len:86 (-) Transcript_20210:1971-2228(-)